MAKHGSYFSLSKLYDNERYLYNGKPIEDPYGKKVKHGSEFYSTLATVKENLAIQPLTAHRVHVSKQGVIKEIERFSIDRDRVIGSCH